MEHLVNEIVVQDLGGVVQLSSERETTCELPNSVTHRIRLGSSAAAFISSISMSLGSYAPRAKDSSASDASLSPVATL